jgi:4-hydroxy-3-methylbut-2-enyl diphosphate reductase IspH
MPVQGPLVVGLTAGASTPDNLIGATILRISAFAASPTGTR